LPQDLARPDQEEIDATLAATRAVIDARVNNTMALNQPKSVPARPGAPQYIKYTPAKQGPEYNSGASHRIIKMHEVPVDPLAPPKFVHKKVRTLCAGVCSMLLREACACWLTRRGAGAAWPRLAPRARAAQPAETCKR
jgi:hypothetical protein